MLEFLQRIDTWPLHDALGSVRHTLTDGGTALTASGQSYTPFGAPQHPQRCHRQHQPVPHWRSRSAVWSLSLTSSMNKWGAIFMGMTSARTDR
jgi:hypothetical protein